MRDKDRASFKISYMVLAGERIGLSSQLSARAVFSFALAIKAAVWVRGAIYERRASPVAVALPAASHECPLKGTVVVHRDADRGKMRHDFNISTWHGCCEIRKPFGTAAPIARRST